MATTIEWTRGDDGTPGETWNPLRGCRRVSPGCENCYAERTAIRHAGAGRPYEGLVRSTRSGPRWTGEVRTVPHKLAEPLSWRKPRRIFVNSMSDLFHEDVPNEYIAAVFGVMAACPQHTFQILTKRADRMREWFRWISRLPVSRGDVEVRQCIRAMDAWLLRGSHMEYPPWPLQNVWLGVSVEDQQRAQERIPLLLECPAAVRWISAEPLLGPVRMDGWLRGKPSHGPWLDWVVVGGESGPGARVCEMDWIEDLVDGCGDAGVPIFVKQLGATVRSGSTVIPLRHLKGADPKEWPKWLRVREYAGEA